MGVVLAFLFPCSIQTPARQRLILTRSPRNLDLLRSFFGGGGVTPSTNKSILYAVCASLQAERGDTRHPSPNTVFLATAPYASHGARAQYFRGTFGPSFRPVLPINSLPSPHLSSARPTKAPLVQAVDCRGVWGKAGSSNPSRTPPFTPSIEIDASLW